MPEEDVELEDPPADSEATVSPAASEAAAPDRAIRVNVGAGRGRGITSRPLILAPATETFPTVRVDSQGAWVRVREPEAVPSFTRRVAPPRVPRTAHQGDPFDLPNDAWLDPHSSREGYTARGVPRGVPVARLDSSSSEEQRGAAAGAPRPRAAPARRPFQQGEVVEAEVEEAAHARQQRRESLQRGSP